MPPFDIAIHGAGLVGQSLAIRLAQAGFQVALVEAKTSHRAVDVRAFALGHAAKMWLESIGAWSNEADTTPITQMQIRGDAGGALDFNALESQECLNWIVEVPALAQRLAQQVTHESSIHTLAPVSIQATLHVVCDRRSDFWQTQLLPQLQSGLSTIPYAQQAIAAKLVSTQPHRQVALQWFNDKGEVLALLPTGGAHGCTYALVWSLASQRAQMLADAQPDVFLEQLGAAQTATQPLALTLTSERAKWPLNLTQLDIWNGQSPSPWVLAGDAAHTVHPLAGQGLNLGLGDAARLAKELIALRARRSSTLPFQPTAQQLGRTLKHYVRARKAAAARIAGTTDTLHLLFSRQNRPLQALRNAGLHTLNRLSFAKQWLIQQAQS